jgi:hypothetical protein
MILQYYIITDSGTVNCRQTAVPTASKAVETQLP